MENEVISLIQISEALNLNRCNNDDEFHVSS